MEMISQFLLTFLFNAVWQIALIVLIAYFCHLLLRQASARIQHLIWLVTLILAFGVPIFTSFSLSRSLFLGSQPIPKTSVKPLFNTNVQPISNDESLPLALEFTPQETNSAFSINKNFSLVLSCLFLLFLIYRSYKLIKAWKQTQTIKNKAFLTEPTENMLRLLEECQKVFNVKKTQIFYSSEIASPITLGVFNPIIILPEQFAYETDRNLLLSALGHELVHIKQRDYLLNLLYEFIYLPLSFHPATMLVKRRIKETRELKCDELVIDKLLSPKIYAQSLVKLASSAIDFGRHSTITIGIGDADILEKRIMKILKKSKMTIQKRNLLLAATSILFVVAFAVAITFTIRPVIAQQNEKSKEEKIKAEKEYVTKEDALMKTKLDAESKMTKTEKDKLFVTRLDNETEAEKLIRQKKELEMTNRLISLAKISMSQAIEIATKEMPGTILECKLIFYNSKDPNDRDAGTPTYAIKIANEQLEKYLLVNAIDGTFTTPTPKQ
ncbi:MAG TPA: M56 family metallopeptidase [Pyrinomonadaceae bacterium]|nr:M56 family metallopeptidase [Pyrinomonadaceae bacterium]